MFFYLIALGGAVIFFAFIFGLIVYVAAVSLPAWAAGLIAATIIIIPAAFLARKDIP